MRDSATHGTERSTWFSYHFIMGAEYHINERDELITLTATGGVSGDEACACISELLSEEAFEPTLPQLVDLRTAEFTGSADDLQRFESFLLGDYRPQLNAIVAIVVNPDWDQETCARAFWLSCALGQAELFDSWNQACKWLIKKDFSATLQDLDVLVDDEVLAEAEATDDEHSGTEPAEADGSKPKSATQRD